MDGTSTAQDLAQPHNLEAEQALLGALLVNNDIFDRVAAIINDTHFYEPVHGRIFSLITKRINKSALASPVTLKPFLADDEGLKLLGGPEYLVTLAAAAVSTFAATEFAEMIRQAALRRKLIEIGETITDKARRMDIDSDPSTQIVEAEQNLYQIAETGGSERGFVTFAKALSESIEVASAAFERDGGLAGLATGLDDLDKKLGGLHSSDLIILAGRPSMGKTSLATNIAFNIARNAAHGSSDPISSEPKKVGFYSLEMSSEQLATRILSDAASISSERIRRGELTEHEFRNFVDASRQIDESLLFIDDTPALPISALAARARRLKRQHGLDVLFVDYLQLVRPASAKDSRVNEVSEITQGLKAIAKELNIPVIALSQLSRQVENRDDKKPQLSDLRESGSIEQDADVVMFVYREEYYVEREKPSEDHEKFPAWQERMDKVHNIAEVVIGKQRHGPIGSVKLHFDGRFTRFSNLARDSQASYSGFE